MPPYLIPECAIEFITLDCITINKIKLGKNIISEAAADTPAPATTLPVALLRVET